MSSAPHRGNLSHDRQVYYATLSDEMQQGMSEESRKQAHQDEYMLRKQRLYEERLRAEEEKNRKKSS
jgi:hypothetical protein